MDERIFQCRTKYADGNLKRFATNKKLVEKFCRGHKKDNLMNAIRKVAF